MQNLKGKKLENIKNKNKNITLFKAIFSLLSWKATIIKTTRPTQNCQDISLAINNTLRIVCRMKNY
jgi:hypothetical protein